MAPEPADAPTTDISPEELKIWIAVRGDLGMSPGKLAAQCGHGVMGLCEQKFRERDALFQEYLASATPKIVVRADTQDQLLQIFKQAQRAKIGAYLVVDAGRTELAPSTPTVCVFGPARRSDLPPLLSRLRLL